MTMKHTLIATVTLLVALSVNAEEPIKGPTVTETFTHAKTMGEEPYLPAYWAICTSLGKAKSDCQYGGFSITDFNQTDKSKWYIGASSIPSSIRPSDDECYHAIVIQHYTTWNGDRGTSYACHAKPEDDKITIEELGAINDAAQKLNFKKTKTLGDHLTAMQIKQFANALLKQGIR